MVIVKRYCFIDIDGYIIRDKPIICNEDVGHISFLYYALDGFDMINPPKFRYWFAGHG